MYLHILVNIAVTLLCSVRYHHHDKNDPAFCTVKVYCIFNKSGVHRTRRASRQNIILMLILFPTRELALILNM
jgi:hypothetical protein